MGTVWPWYRDKRDGHPYELIMFACDQDDQIVFVLKSRKGALNLTSPPPGYENSVLELDDRPENDTAPDQTN